MPSSLPNCSPGGTQVTGGCGNCGQLQRVCAADCTWGAASYYTPVQYSSNPGLVYNRCRALRSRYWDAAFHASRRQDAKM